MKRLNRALLALAMFFVGCCAFVPTEAELARSREVGRCEGVCAALHDRPNVAALCDANGVCTCREDVAIRGPVSLRECPEICTPRRYSADRIWPVWGDGGCSCALFYDVDGVPARSP